MKSSTQTSSKGNIAREKKSKKVKSKKDRSKSGSDDDLDSIQSEGSVVTEAFNQTKSDAELDASSVINERPTRFNKKDLLSFNLPTTTSLVFISIDGIQTVHALDKRILSYSELQCEIARIMKKNQSMYVIQDVDGNVMPAVPFYGYDVIRVKETSWKPNHAMLKSMTARWEKEDYYGTGTGS